MQSAQGTGGVFPDLLQHVQASLDDLRHELASARQDCATTTQQLRKGILREPRRPRAHGVSLPFRSEWATVSETLSLGRQGASLRADSDVTDQRAGTSGSKAGALEATVLRLDSAVKALDQRFTSELDGVQRHLAAMAVAQTAKATQLAAITHRVEGLEGSHGQLALEVQRHSLPALPVMSTHAAPAEGAGSATDAAPGNADGAAWRDVALRLQTQVDELAARLDSQALAHAAQQASLQQRLEAAESAAGGRQGDDEVKLEVDVLAGRVQQLVDERTAEAARAAAAVNAVSSHTRECPAREVAGQAAELFEQTCRRLALLEEEVARHQQYQQQQQQQQQFLKQQQQQLEEQAADAAESGERSSSSSSSSNPVSPTIKSRMDAFERKMNATISRFIPPGASPSASPQTHQHPALHDLRTRVDELAGAVRDLQGGAPRRALWAAHSEAAAQACEEVRQLQEGLQRVEQDAQAGLQQVKCTLDGMLAGSTLAATTAGAIEQLASDMVRWQDRIERLELAQHAASAPGPAAARAADGGGIASASAGLGSPPGGSAVVVQGPTVQDPHVMCCDKDRELQALRGAVGAHQQRRQGSPGDEGSVAGYSGNTAATEGLAQLRSDLDGVQRQLASLLESRQAADVAQGTHGRLPGSGSAGGSPRGSGAARSAAESQQASSTGVEGDAAATAAAAAGPECSMPGDGDAQAHGVASLAAAGRSAVTAADLQQAVDAAQQALFDLRVEMQNEVAALGSRLEAAAASASDAGILADSCKAAAQRAEAQAADAVEKVEEVADAVTLLKGSASISGSGLQTSLKPQVLEGASDDGQQQQQQQQLHLEQLQQQVAELQAHLGEQARQVQAAVVGSAQNGDEIRALCEEVLALCMRTSDVHDQLQSIQDSVAEAAEVSRQALDSAGAAASQVAQLRLDAGSSLTHLGTQVGLLEAQLVPMQRPRMAASIDSLSSQRLPTPGAPQAFTNTLFDADAASSEGACDASIADVRLAVGALTPLSVYSNATYEREAGSAALSADAGGRAVPAADVACVVAAGTATSPSPNHTPSRLGRGSLPPLNLHQQLVAAGAAAAGAAAPPHADGVEAAGAAAGSDGDVAAGAATVAEAEGEAEEGTGDLTGSHGSGGASGSAPPDAAEEGQQAPLAQSSHNRQSLACDTALPRALAAAAADDDGEVCLLSMSVSGSFDDVPPFEPAPSHAPHGGWSNRGAGSEGGGGGSEPPQPEDSPGSRHGATPSSVTGDGSGLLEEDSGLQLPDDSGAGGGRARPPPARAAAASSDGGAAGDAWGSGAGAAEGTAAAPSALSGAALATPQLPLRAGRQSPFFWGDVIDLLGSDGDSDLLAPTPTQAEPPDGPGGPAAAPAGVPLGEGVERSSLGAPAATAAAALWPADSGAPPPLLRLRGGWGGSGGAQGLCRAPGWGAQEGAACPGDRTRCSGSDGSSGCPTSDEDTASGEPGGGSSDGGEGVASGDSRGSCEGGQVEGGEWPALVTPCTYRLLLQTSALAGAGTDAQATVEVEDGEGRCHRRCLPGVRLVRGGRAQIFLEADAPVRGGCRALRVWHDGAGFASSWLLESVTVESLHTGERWRFSNAHWVHGGGPLQGRCLQPAGHSTGAAPVPACSGGTPRSAALPDLGAAGRSAASAADPVHATPAPAHVGKLHSDTGRAPASPRAMDALPAAGPPCAAGLDGGTPLDDDGVGAGGLNSSGGADLGCGLSQAQPQPLGVAGAAQPAATRDGWSCAVDIAPLQPLPPIITGPQRQRLQQQHQQEQEPHPSRPESRQERAARKAGLQRRGSTVPPGTLGAEQAPANSDAEGDPRDGPPSPPGPLLLQRAYASPARALAARPPPLAPDAGPAWQGAWPAAHTGAHRPSGGAAAGQCRVSGTVGALRQVPLASSETGEAGTPGHACSTPAEEAAASWATAAGGCRGSDAAGRTLGSLHAPRPCAQDGEGDGNGGDALSFSWVDAAGSSPRIAGDSAHRSTRARRDGDGSVVRFSRWAHQLEFEGGGSSDSGSGGCSVASFTEEELLEAQGELLFTSQPREVGYAEVMQPLPTQHQPAAADGGGGGGGGGLPRRMSPLAAAKGGSPLTIDACSVACDADGGGGLAAGVAPAPHRQQPPPSFLQEVPLVANKPGRRAAEYRLRFFTADRVGAGLPGGLAVHLELLSASGVVVTHQLPRPPGSFRRGCVDCFKLRSEAGDLGEPMAVRVWVEPPGGLTDRAWCLELLDLEHRVRGVRWRFVNGLRDGWVGRGAARAVVLAARTTSRLDEREELAAERAELAALQAEANGQLMGAHERERVGGHTV